MTSTDGQSWPERLQAHQAAVDELMRALHSERVQRFLNALREIDDAERRVILDKVLTGPPSMRIDLGLPPEIQISRRFVGGPASEFAVSKRAKETGALVTIFVSLAPSADGPAFRQILPWHPSEN